MLHRDHESQPKFDVTRAILRKGEAEQPLHIDEMQPLQRAVSNQLVSHETSLQVVEICGTMVSVVTREILLFDAVQGRHDSFDWLMTFCPICNAGALFSATLDDVTFHFVAGGIYNAIAILRDVETGSYWDVIKGECLYGASEGKQLQRLTTLRHMLARDALAAHPDIEVALLPLTAQDVEDSKAEDQFRVAARPEWSSRLANTLTFEDSRLPRFDMGLGIWTSHLARYYPLMVLNGRENMTFDDLDGRNIVVYIDPVAQIPDAFYTDAAAGRWFDTTLELNNGQKVKGGVVYDRDGNRLSVERPLQLFQRWYGFAVMFRGCEIFGIP